MSCECKAFPHDEWCSSHPMQIMADKINSGLEMVMVARLNFESLFGFNAELRESMAYKVVELQLKQAEEALRG